MQIVSFDDDFDEMSKPIVWENNSNIINLLFV